MPDKIVTSATTFKPFAGDDKTSTRTLLHEAIPITGALCSGTYNEGGTTTETNIKNYAHGMFQTIYDYPYLSSSSNHIFDITCGYSSNSDLSGSDHAQNAKKINMYNVMAQQLAGHDVTGAIREFDEDGDLTAGTKIQECYFVSFSRLLVKDEIKKGSFEMKLGVDDERGLVPASNPNFNKIISIVDASGSNSYFTNSPAGDYGILYATSSHVTEANNAVTLRTNEGTGKYIKCGLVYYQAGIAVLTGSLFEQGCGSATLMTDSTSGINGLTLILKKANGDDHTMTVSAGATSATNINLSAIGNANDLATQINATLDAAVAGGHLDMTIDDVSDDSAGNARVTQVIQKTAGTAGNTTIGGTLVSGNKVIVNNETAGGSHGTLTFLGGNATGLLTLDSEVQGPSSTHETINAALTGSTIETNAANLRNRLYNIKFNNTTELNSTQYFCRINHNSFNYSANPTYLTGSKIRVREDFDDLPISYITSVGLYSADNELMAVAKLSEPLKKDPSTELTIRVRLDY